MLRNATEKMAAPPAQVILESNGVGNGGPVADYIYLAGKLVAEYKNATTYFVHSDILGTTRVLTALDKSVFDSMDYLPFGEQISGGSGTTHKFTEDERDSESNLDHTQFRQYSSSLARWMHPDPAGLAAVDPSNPQSWNRYSYVTNSPLNSVDPSGLAPCTGGRPHADQDGFCPGDNLLGGGLMSGVGAGFLSVPILLPGDSITFGVSEISNLDVADNFDSPDYIYLLIPNVFGDSGGGGNSSGGFWQRTKTVNQCAAKNASSLASVFHANQNNFWVSTFLGNDASALSNLAFGPGRMDAAASLAVSNPTKYSLINLGANAVGQIPTGGQIYVASALVQTPYGEAINMTPVSQTIGGVAGKAVGAAAEAFTAVKAVFDVGAYIYAEVGCAVK